MTDVSNSDRGWLVIPVEVQVRELLARLLVGAIAADRGYRVLIGHDRVVRRLARFLPRGILFDKSLGAKGDRKVRRYARLGYKIVALDEESTGFYANPELYFATRLSEDTLAMAERWLCISDTLRDRVERQYPDHAAKFRTTGLPRTDIWREAFHDLYAYERRAIEKSHGPFILFCSNFGSIIHARAGKFVENQFRKQDAAHAGADTYRRKVLEQGRKNLEAFNDLLPWLADRFPDYRIIIRPHPSEDRAYWREIARTHAHLEVQDSGLATPWILASQCLLHHGCTTGIEAELLGQPHLMYAPHPDAHHDTEVMRCFAPMLHDRDELQSTMQQILAGDRSRTRNRADLQKYYASLIGPLVSERIVDTLDEIPAGPATDLPAYLGLLRFTPRHLAAQYAPRSARAAAYSKQKWQGTSADEIERALSVMESAASLGSHVTAEEVFPQLYRLHAQPRTDLPTPPLLR